MTAENKNRYCTVSLGGNIRIRKLHLRAIGRRRIFKFVNISSPLSRTVRPNKVEE